MGGSGSGNWYRGSTKPTEENFHRFSIVRLKHYGLIGKPMRASGNWQWTCNDEVISSMCYDIRTLYEDSPHLRVHYTNTRSGEKYDYKILLTTTRPHYGGERWWFRCPVQGCGRRVAVLYLAQIFACRHCCKLAYSSQNEAPHYRQLHKAQKIHQQLGGDWALDGGEPPKPKGMHWKTYWRKVAQMEAADSASWQWAAQRFGMEF